MRFIGQSLRCSEQIIPRPVCLGIFHSHLIKDRLVVVNRRSIIVLGDSINPSVYLVHSCYRLRKLAHINSRFFYPVGHIQKQPGFNIIRRADIHPEYIRSGSCRKRGLQLRKIFPKRNNGGFHDNAVLGLFKQPDHFIHSCFLRFIPIIEIDHCFRAVTVFRLFFPAFCRNSCRRRFFSCALPLSRALFSRTSLSASA